MKLEVAPLLFSERYFSIDINSFKNIYNSLL